MSNDKAFETVTARILEALDKGDVPWRKPWGTPKGIRPQSISGHPYSGINAVVLGMSGYRDPRWLTYRKAQELGGHVRKGEKSTPVVLWKPLQRDVENENGEKETKTFWLLRYYSVFNVQQCEGLGLPAVNTDAHEFDPIETAESIIAKMPHRPGIDHNGGDRAFYVPTLDEIHLPPKSAFNETGEYYSTAFHELGHSTGHESRLNRHGLETGIAAFGSEVYSREELAAEFCAAFLCNESGIENTIDNSAAYIAGWAKVIRKDKRLVVKAAAQGQKAADYVLGYKSEEREG